MKHVDAELRKGVAAPFRLCSDYLPVKSFNLQFCICFVFPPQDRHCAVRNDPRCFVCIGSDVVVRSMDIHNLTLLVFEFDERPDNFFSHNG